MNRFSAFVILIPQEKNGVILFCFELDTIFIIF